LTVVKLVRVLVIFFEIKFFLGISKWPHISVECLLYRLQHYSQVASLILDKFWQVRIDFIKK